MSIEDIDGLEDWLDGLRELAEQHGECVDDVTAWAEEFHAGKTYQEAFYEEFPEHKH